MSYTVKYRDKKIHKAYFNLVKFCRSTNYSISTPEYIKLIKLELSKFNCVLIRDSNNFVFETEQDYMFFLLKWS